MILATVSFGGNTYYASNEWVNDATRWWDPYVLSTSANFRMAERMGGYIKPEFGSIDFSPSLFATDWPPPDKIDIVLAWTLGDPSDPTQVHPLFSGTGYFRKHVYAAVTYELYGEELSQSLLATVTDYNEEEVPAPMAFGAVEFVPALRLPDQNNHQCYHMGGIGGTLHTHWHVYDDGVDVCSNVTNVADGKFEYTVAPVGTIYLSGSNTAVSTLSEVFQWFCDVELDFDGSASRSPSPTLGVWVDQQVLTVDFLSQAAAFFSHCFYVADGTVYLIDMLAEVGETVVTGYDLFEVEYGFERPTKQITVSWTARVPELWKRIVGDPSTWVLTGGIVETPVNVVVKAGVGIDDAGSKYEFGQDVSIPTTMTTDTDDAEAALLDMASILNSYTFMVKMPLEATIPGFGQRLTWLDESFYEPLELYMMVRSIEYDFESEEVTIRGEGGFVVS